VRPTEVEGAEVRSGDAVAGSLERTREGSRFTYHPGFLEACRARGWGLGFAVPMTPVVETQGVNLLPFLAGLLPEGLRLQALEGAVKTSADDLLSLLIAAGEEAVGDVRVLAHGGPGPGVPVLDLDRLEQASFSEVLARSLDYRHRGERRLISGVQPKVSAAMWTLPVRTRGRRRGEAMLKLAPPEFPRLVENEHFFMTMARACGLRTAEVQVVHDGSGTPGLLVERFDRPVGGPAARLHCEDGCQLLGRYPADKYRVSFRELLDGVARYATAPALALPEVLRLLTFSYLIANGDLHARNVSLLVDASGRVDLAPAYDLLTTLPYGDRRLALRTMGRDDKLTRAHLLELGRLVGLGTRSVSRVVDEVCEGAAPWLGRLAEVGFSGRRTADLERVTRRRLAALT
jgi:serine/threonine-protein kinase HipA